MSELTIYDRFGDPVGSDSPTDEQYKMFDRKGVLVSLDTSGHRPRLTCSFRAHDQPGGRSNRFFADFTGDEIGSLFVDCRRAIERRVDELGWRLDTRSNSDRVETFLGLTETGADDVDLGDQAEQISWLLSRGHRGDFGVSDVQFALAVLKQFLTNGSAHGSFVIGNNGRVPETEAALLVLQPGVSGANGLQPIGETSAALDEAREHWEQQFFETRMRDITDAITESVRQSTQRTSYTDERIENGVVDAVNAGFRQSGLNVEATDREALRELDDLRHEVYRLQTRQETTRSIPRWVWPVSVVIVLLIGLAGGVYFAPELGSLPFP